MKVGRIALAAALAAGATLPVVAAAAAPADRAVGMFAGCAPAGATVRVGVVSCELMPTRLLGGSTAFSYYVPPACAHVRCPALYLLHGFGGDYTSMLGTAAHPTAWVAALAAGPPAPPEQSAAPWEEADPARWVAARPLDMVLVAPDGRTTPGGYGPAAGLEGFWADWNPRYARGGDSRVYDTPPPRFASYVVEELVPFVEGHLPVHRGRAWRALAGTSLGGYGSYAIGLLHPDMWSSIGAVSGIMNILLLPGLDPSTASVPVGVQPPVRMPVLRGPGHLPPLSALPPQLADFAVATYAFGDPTADQAYYRGNQPRDLAFNALAFRGATPALVIRGFSNDAVSRQPADVASPPGYLTAQAFETIVLWSNLELNAAFDHLGVAYTYQLHPGVHEDAYWNAWLREQEEAQYAMLRHVDGGGDPPPMPAVFDYRSIEPAFSVWGWSVRVYRPTVEFLQLSDVSCAGFTVRGTGHVAVLVPARCHTGWHGSRLVRLDLGDGQATDAPGTADAAPVYGRTLTVRLTPR